MKKALFVILGIFILIIIYAFGFYNKMITAGEEVDSKWAQVENVYQRRQDLIPNLVNTVKGYASHEEETLLSVVEARAKSVSTNININNTEELAQFKVQQQELSKGLGRLMAIAESYPDLKASQNFSKLQDQLEGSENRISIERKRFNEAAKNYNVVIKRFPGRFFASIFGFEKKNYFEAAEGAEVAPEVNFE